MERRVGGELEREEEEDLKGGLRNEFVVGQ